MNYFLQKMNSRILLTKNFDNDLALLLLRITSGGLLFIDHGIGKIDKLMNPPVTFMDFMGLGPEASLLLVIVAEAVCALLVVLGLGTRIACIPLVINFLVVLFNAQAGKPFPQIELPLIFLLSFIIIFITGAGNYSLDRLLLKQQ
jgi:putative oxidoreductase